MIASIELRHAIRKGQLLATGKPPHKPATQFYVATTRAPIVTILFVNI